MFFAGWLATGGSVCGGVALKLEYPSGITAVTVLGNGSGITRHRFHSDLLRQRGWPFTDYFGKKKKKKGGTALY